MTSRAYPSKSDFLRAIPRLRVFALSLTGEKASADDLVQEALQRAWGSMDTLESCTTLDAWLFTIVRKAFHGTSCKPAVVLPPAFQPDIQDALSRLPAGQREALLLVAVLGLSCTEAASVMGCVSDTVRNRIARARTSLAHMFGKQFHTPAAWHSGIMHTGMRH
jgi:RNA polymerase sigma-70 factor, ECF subfamily